MYSWPNDFEVNVFVGRTIQVVTFTLNTANIVFDPPCSITVLSGFVLRMTDTALEESTIPVGKTQLPQLIGFEVQSAKLLNQRDLCLTFNNGSQLSIDGASTDYECYSVKLGEREVII